MHACMAGYAMPSPSSSSSGGVLPPAIAAAAAVATSLLAFGVGLTVGYRLSGSSPGSSTSCTEDTTSTSINTGTPSSATRKAGTIRSNGISNDVDYDGMNGTADPDPDTKQRQQQQHQQQQNLCECGFDLTPLSSHAIAHHRTSNLHRSNLYRTRGAQLLLTAKVNEYRRAIATHVTSEDVVLEVGCAEGLTTQRLAQRARVAIGIDLYGRLVDRARARVGIGPEEDEEDGKARDGAGDDNSDNGQGGGGGAGSAGSTDKRAAAHTTKDDDDDENDNNVKVNIPPGKGWSNLHFYTADAMDKQAVLRAVNRALGVNDAQYEESKRLERDRVDALIEEELLAMNGTNNSNGDDNITTTNSSTSSAGEQKSTNHRHGIAASSSLEELSNKQRRLLRRAAIGRRDCADITNADGTTTVPAILRSTGRLHTGKVNKIWLDVSGSRETRTVVQLVEILDAMFRPELIVVKSDKLKNLFRRTHLPSSVIPGITHEADATPYVIS